MNKKTLIITISSVIAVTLISGVVVFKVTGTSSDPSKSGTVSSASPGSISVDTDDNNDDFTYIPPTSEDSIDEEDEVLLDQEIKNFVPATEMDLDPTSVTVYVNKEHALPKDYRPKDLVKPDIYFNFTYFDERTLLRPEAAKAIEKLFAAAKKDGYILAGVSGFRSYERQYKIFTTNIVTKGKDHTLKYSAVPGTSEHQTGLAMDVSSESLGNKLTTEFADSPEGKWLADNAYKYGYIIRYPLGKAEITGYAYEPWHIRYVGRGLANYLHENNLTLDEYYKYTPSPGFDFETLYADLINYIPPKVTIIPTEGDGVIVGENGEIIEGEVEEDTTSDDKDDKDNTDDTDGKGTKDPNKDALNSKDDEDSDGDSKNQPEDNDSSEDTSDVDTGDGEDQTDTDNPVDNSTDDNSTDSGDTGSEPVDTDGDGIPDVQISPTPTPTPAGHNNGATDITN